MLRRFVLLTLITSIIAASVVPFVSAQEPRLEPITIDNANQIEELARFGNGVFTGSLAYSPDGKTLAVAGSIGIWLYDTSNFEQSPRLIDLHTSVTQVAFSTNGEYLVYRSSEGVFVTDFESGDVVLTIPGGTDFAIHPDSKHLSVSFRKAVPDAYFSYTSIEIWDIETKEHLQTVGAGDEPFGVMADVSEMAFSPNGDALALNLKGEDFDDCGQHQSYVAVWTFDQQLKDFEILLDAEQIAFRPTESLLYTAQQIFGMGYTGGLKIWDTDKQTQEQGKSIIDFSTSRPSFSDFAIKPDGSELILLNYDEVLLVDADTLTILKTLATNSELQHLASNPTSQQFVAMSSQALWIWEAEDEAPTIINLDASLINVSFNHDVTGFVASKNDQLQLWSLDGTSAEKIHQEKALFRAFSGSKVAFETESNFHVWDFAQQRELLSFESSMLDERTQFTFSKDSSLLGVVKDDTVIEIWDMVTVERIQEIQVGKSVRQLQFSPDSLTLLGQVSGDSDKGVAIYLWELGTPDHPHVISGNGTSLTTAFSPDGTSLFVTQNLIGGTAVGGRIAPITYQWKLEGFALNDVFVGEALGFLENENIVHSSRIYSDGFDRREMITLRDSRTLEEIITIQNGVGSTSARGSFFSPDASRLLTFTAQTTRCGGESYHTLDLRDLHSQIPIVTIPAGIDPIVDFSPIGSSFVLSGYSQFTILSPSTGEEIASIPAHDDYLRNIAFNTDGTMILTSSDDGTVRLWGVPIND